MIDCYELIVVAEDGTLNSYYFADLNKARVVGSEIETRGFKVHIDKHYGMLNTRLDKVEDVVHDIVRDYESGEQIYTIRN